MQTTKQQPAGSPPALELVDVAIAPGQRRERCLLEGISWRVQPGEWWGITGAPGSGKSDLLFTLAGLQPPARGEVRWFGQPIPAEGGVAWAASRRRVGLVFEQGGRLFHRLTVKDNVALGLCYHENLQLEAAAERVTALLSWVGLAESAHSTPGRLRPAGQQRVALARALALEPDVLLVDNPAVGLPGSEVQWWLGALAQLQAASAPISSKPLTIVMTCEDAAPWREAPARWVALRDRHWCELGQAQEPPGRPPTDSLRERPAPQ